MKMTIETKPFIKALEKILLKGKYITSSGVKNAQLSNYAEIIVTDCIEIRNADNSTAIKTIFHGEIEEQGTFITEIDKMIKYLKTMGEETAINSDDVIKLTSTGKKVTLPMVVTHPYMSTIEMLCTPINFDATLEESITYGKKDTPYNTAIQMMANDLIDAITSCESVGSGIYEFNCDDSFVISSSLGAEKYSQEVTTINIKGDPATIDISAPIHKLFKNEVINLYMNDDVPITIISPTSFLVRAPRLTGN